MGLPLVSNVLQEIEDKKTKKEKIALLKYHAKNTAMIQLFKYVFDPKIKFALPEGAPPYKPSEEFEDNDSGLYRELRKMYIFIEGSSVSNIHPIKRERLFIDFLESINPKEAVLMIAVKDKTLPYKSINKKLIDEAFPGLL